MISCLLHKPALQRYVDDGQALSAKANAHLEKCEDCREMVAAHLAIVRQLKAARGEEIETPAFLHARVMSGLEGAPVRGGGLRLQWMGAVAAAVVVAVVVWHVGRKPTPERVASWPEVPIKVAFKAELPANPLETEIAKLREDAFNAAKALAATFLPESDSR